MPSRTEDDNDRMASPHDLRCFLDRALQQPSSPWRPGSGQFIPEVLRCKTVGLLHAYTRVAPRGHPSVDACGTAAAQMAQCWSSVRWWHVPAAVRWACMVALEHVSEQLVDQAGNTPTNRLSTSRAVLKSLVDASEASVGSPRARDAVEEFSRCLTLFAAARTNDLPPLGSDQLDTLLCGWNSPSLPTSTAVSSSTCIDFQGDAGVSNDSSLLAIRDDTVEELHLVLQCVGEAGKSVSTNLDTLDTRVFVTVATSALANIDYLPRRFLSRLRSEIERLTDILHGAVDIVRYLHRAELATLFSYECCVAQGLRPLIANAAGLLPEVCKQSYRAMEELHAHLPPFVSVASRVADVRRVISTAPLSHSSAAAALRWVVGESAYSRSGDSAVAVIGGSSSTAVSNFDPSESDPLDTIRWPYTLWEVVDSCSSCPVSFRGSWMQTIEAMQDVGHRRQGMQVMRSEIERLDALHQSMLHLDDDERVEAPVLASRATVAADPTRETPECTAAAEELLSRILDKEEELVRLHEKLSVHEKTLTEAEQIVSTFLCRILVAKSEIGDLRQQSHLRAVALKNARTLESVVCEVVDAVSIPVDVVQVITSETASSDGELGQQFLHALRTLLRVMQLRQRLSAATSVLPRAAVAQVAGVAEDLVILACVRIKMVVEERIVALKRPRANLAVHQEHSLGALRAFVHCVKEAVDILRHRPPAVVEPGIDECTRSAEAEYCHGTPRQLLYHFRVCASIYAEIKATYVQTLRAIYFVNIDRYLMQLNRLESATSQNSSTAPKRQMGVFAGRAVVLPDCLSFPLITDLHHRVRASDFGIGKARIRMFAGLLRHPVVPIVLQSKNQRLTYEETFRSINVMLCDTVTREYLFSFDFFGGDGDIYVDVFQPLLQRCVDYVAEVVLCTGRASGQTCAQNMDAIALLSLIRMCHIFRAHMYAVRRLACLNTFYDSLTAQLWPAFKRAFDLQLAAMRSTTPSSMCDFLMSFRSPVEKLSCIHPVTERYAEFSSALLTLSVALRRSSDGDAAFASAALSRDDVDSEDHFVVLRSNLAHLRVEFTRLLTSLSPQLTANGVPLAAALPTTPLLNNLYFVLSVWSSLTPLVIDETQEGDVSSDPSLGFVERIVPVSPITDTDDFLELKSSLNLARAQFVEHAIAHAVPALVSAANLEAEDSLEPAAATFTASWRPQLAQLVELLQQTINHPQNFRETLSQVCMQLVLYNTRLHALLGKSVKDGGNSLRRLVVTNHTLLSHIRALTNGALPQNDEERE